LVADVMHRAVRVFVYIFIISDYVLPYTITLHWQKLLLERSSQNLRIRGSTQLCRMLSINYEWISEKLFWKYI